MSLLIITSTVTVNSGLTVLVDPSARLKQYIDSILFYLSSQTIHKIIVCDNSGFDYSKISALSKSAYDNKKVIEFLNFLGSIDQIQEFGKGYGEGEIMSFVFNNSLLIRQEEQTFFKVTGRLKVQNVDTISRYVKPNTVYFQAVNLNPFVNLRKVDTRFYLCNKHIFKEYLNEGYLKVDDKNGVFLEHVYYQRLINEKINFKNFNVLPNFIGVSGSLGKSYNISKSKFLVRQILFFVLKVLHIKVS